MTSHSFCEIGSWEVGLGAFGVPSKLYVGSSPVLVITCHHKFCKGCHLIRSGYAITQLINATPNQRNRFFFKLQKN